MQRLEGGNRAAGGEHRVGVSADRVTAAGMRRLVVAEEEPGDADAATQTETAAEVSVSSQTESASKAAVQVCKTQTAGYEMVVGRQLHPAQAERWSGPSRRRSSWSTCGSRLRRRQHIIVWQVEWRKRSWLRHRCTEDCAGDNTCGRVSAQDSRKAQLRRQAAAADVDVGR